MPKRTILLGPSSGPRRAPDAPGLELELLGTAIHEWDRLGLESLDPELFTSLPRRRVAEAINAAAGLGAVSPEIIISLTPGDSAAVAEAAAAAGFVHGAGAALKQLRRLAVQRRRFYKAANTYQHLGVPLEAEEEAAAPAPAPVPKRDRPSVSGWRVADAWMDGQAHYVIEAGPDTYEATAAELREGSAVDHLPTLEWVGTRQLRDAFNEDVRRRGAALMRRPETLPGYTQVAPYASAEGWGQICDELVKSPRLAFYVGAALASYFLVESGRQYELRPLGFAVHAIGEPGTGKTTAQLAAAAVVGTPALAPEGLLYSWGGTQKGAPVLGSEVGRYPLVRSDTSTWERSGAELALACMQLFEGPRVLSSRQGELVTVGRAYQGILLSTGNDPICSAVARDRGAILRRVLELNGPLTINAEHAHRLARLATENHGWPIAQVRDGRFSGDRFAVFVDEAAGLLVRDEAGPIRDAALRSAVVVAGAAALGALVDDDRLEAMANAAMTGAEELLEGLRLSLDESHPPIGRALLEAVWDAIERRGGRFPLLHNGAVAVDRDGPPWPPAEIDGFLTFDDGEKRAKVFPDAVAKIAADKGITAVEPALRELRDAGLLVAPAGKLRGLVVRRDGNGGYRRLRVYVFREVPEPDEVVERAPLEPLTRAPEGARVQNSATREYDVRKVTRAPRAPSFERKDLREGSKQGARAPLYFRAVSDGERFWYRGGLETVPEEGLGALVGRVGELAGEQTPVLWVSPDGRRRLGLPDRLEAAVAVCRDAGLLADQRGDSVIRLGPKGALAHVTDYGNEFRDLEGERLWRALELFSATTGLEYVHSPGTTVNAMILRARRVHRLAPASPEPPLRPAIHRSAWSVPAWDWQARRAREMPPGGALAAYDRNAAYLAAWRRCELPGDDWQEVGPSDLGTGRLAPGYYRLELGALAEELEGRDLPPVFARHGPAAPAVWVTAPLAVLAAELADEFGLPPVRCQLAYTAEGHQYLDTVAERLTKAYNALKAEGSLEASAARDALKGMYSAATLQFESHAHNEQGRAELWRPAWCHTVLDRHAANTFRDLQGAGVVGWSNIDHATFMVPPGGALKTGTTPGTWKRDQ